MSQLLVIYMLNFFFLKLFFFFFFQAEDGIRDDLVTGVQTCALPILQQGDKTFFVSKSFETYGGLTPLTSGISIPSFVVLRCPAAAQRCLKVYKIQQRGYPREIFRSAQNLNLPRNHQI